MVYVFVELMSRTARQKTIIIQKRFFVIVPVFLLAVGAAVAAIFILPSAKITLTPASREKKVEQAILITTAAEDPDYQRFILPASSVQAEGEATLTKQREGGAARIARAKGAVRLKNDQDEEQPLLPQTHLRHEATGIFFLTTAAVRIPPRGEVEVAVTAKEEGPGGNVSAGKFIVDKLPVSLQTVVYGESAAAFSGGEVFDTPLSGAELKQAEEEVVAEALEKARGTLTAQAGGAIIRDDLISHSITEQSTSAQAGSLSTTYAVSAKVTLRAFVVDDNDVLSLTLLKLQAHAEPDEEFVSYAPESFSIDFERADFERGEAHITGHLTGLFTQKTESTIFDTRALAGRTPAEVAEYFRRFASVESVVVELSPFWVTSVPSRAEAVEIAVRKK